MKRVALVVMALVGTMLLPACGSTGTTATSGTAIQEASYQTKDLNVYREKDVIDKTIPIRFYEEMPNVPYIGVKAYYKEFFAVDYTMEEQNGIYTFTNDESGGYIFDTRLDDVTIIDIETFNDSPEFVTDNTKTFLSEVGSETTRKHNQIISLKSYGIDIHGDEDDAYVPLTLLSNFSGGKSFYQVAYNGKDIYVLDMMGTAHPGEKRDTNYFSDTYYEVIADTKSPRPDDLAEYTYNQLCLTFDNERGYTSQLVFGDNNLLTLGLDGIMELYHPSLKEHLLSTDKLDYYAGYLALAGGLYDGGHTTILMVQDPTSNTKDPLFLTLKDQLSDDADLKSLVQTFIKLALESTKTTNVYKTARAEAFGLKEASDTDDGEATDDGAAEPDDPGFYYHYDEKTQTAYIGFNHFVIDYVAWDTFFAEGKDASQAPVDTDSFSFVRSSMYQAQADGAKYLVLDLTTNGGGDEAALLGIMGLFNGAKATMSQNNVANKYRSATDYDVDINLDGECDQDDVAEANKFDFKVAVLTSKCSFSCGNLLPSMMEQAGYKIVGERSGGGSCAVSYEFTADGLPYVRSSYSCLSNEVGDNIDTGVPLDYDIAKELGGLSREEAAPHFYDPELLSTYLATAYDAA